MDSFPNFYTTLMRHLVEDKIDEAAPIWQKIYVVVVLITMFAILLTDRFGCDLVLLGALILFMAPEIITVSEGLQGFATSGIWSVLFLIVVAKGIHSTGALDWYMMKLLGKPSSESVAQLRLMLPLTIVSVFLNNTPVVVLMIPIVIQWAQHCCIPVKQLLIPLSFAVILGGTCSTIGSSTNLVVVGSLENRYTGVNAVNIGTFELGLYGVPVALVGLAYILLTAPWLLPNGSIRSKKSNNSASQDFGNFLLGAKLMPYSPAAGRTVHRSGLRDTGGIYLVAVMRAATGDIHCAVSRDFVLTVGDVLYFTGYVETFGDFCEEHGLEVVTQNGLTNKNNVPPEKDGIFIEEESPDHCTTSIYHNDSTHSTTVEIGITLDSLLLASDFERLCCINRFSDIIRNSEDEDDDIIATNPSAPPQIIILIKVNEILIGINAPDNSGMIQNIFQELSLMHLQLHHTEVEVIQQRSISVWRAQPNSQKHFPAIEDLWGKLKEITSPSASRGGLKSSSRVIKVKVTTESRLVGAKPSQIDFQELYGATFLLNLANQAGLQSQESIIEKPFEANDVLVLLVYNYSPLFLELPAQFLNRATSNKFSKFSFKFRTSEELSSSSTDPDPVELVWRDLQVVPCGKNVSSSREFLTAMTVSTSSPLVGQSVNQLALDKMHGTQLVTVERLGTTESKTKVNRVDLEAGGSSAIVDNAKAPVTALDFDKPLQSGDILWFAGSASVVGNLRKIPGLVSSQSGEVNKLNERVHDRRLVQAVVACNGPLVGQKIKKLRFRTRFGAAVLAVHRGGNRIHELPERIRLRAGDVLLLEAGKTFMSKKDEHDRSFAMMVEVANSTPPHLHHLMPALIFTAAMVAIPISQVTTILITSMCTAFLMVISGILSEDEARKALHWDLFVTIGSAFGIGTAMVNAGIAGYVADFLVKAGEGIGMGDAGVLGAVYLAAALMTNVITANASAALIFPIAMDAAEKAGIDIKLMSFALMIGASASFMTPFSYQCNLLVYRAGEYQAKEFLYFGIPLQIVLFVATTAFLVIRPWYISWIASIVILLIVILYRGVTRMF